MLLALLSEVLDLLVFAIKIVMSMWYGMLFRSSFCVRNILFSDHSCSDAFRNVLGSYHSSLHVTSCPSLSLLSYLFELLVFHSCYCHECTFKLVRNILDLIIDVVRHDRFKLDIVESLC